MAETFQPRLKSVPAQLIQVEGYSVLRWGCIELRFREPAYDRLLPLLLEAFRSGATEDDVTIQFAQYQRSDISGLIRLLHARGILVPSVDGSDEQLYPENPLALFYEHCDPQGGSIPERIRSRKIAILGINCVSRSLAMALRISGFEDIAMVEYPIKYHSGNVSIERSAEDPSFKPPIQYETWVDKNDWQKLDCLIATSDIGGRNLLREWNELAIQKDCHFLPIVLQDLIGYIGPFVIPRNTACYECLISRENSQQKDFVLRRAIEENALTGRPAFHPHMATVLGQIAAFELTKFYSEIIPGRQVGVLIELNLLATTLKARRVLKIPRCVVCSNLHVQPSVSIHRDIP